MNAVPNSPASQPCLTLSGTLSWLESEWATRRRSDAGKLAGAARLRSETTLPIKWIAARVHIGTAKGAKTVLHQLAHGHYQRKPANTTKRCAQLEFQSTV